MARCPRNGLCCIATHQLPGGSISLFKECTSQRWFVCGFSDLVSDLVAKIDVTWLSGIGQEFPTTSSSVVTARSLARNRPPRTHLFFDTPDILLSQEGHGRCFRLAMMLLSSVSHRTTLFCVPYNSTIIGFITFVLDASIN